MTINDIRTGETAAEWSAIIAENIKAHGKELETTVAMEECAELIQAISKVKRYGCSGNWRENLVEEMVDVTIILGEIATMFGIKESDFAKMMSKKIQQIKERLHRKAGDV